MADTELPKAPKPDTKTSKFRIFSMGLVVVDKPLRTYTIEVVPHEYNPFHSGEATDNVDTYEAKDKGEDGADAVDLALKTTASLKAEWIPYGNTNRITPPDVRRGDEVLIFQFSDSDCYFWILWRRNGLIPRRETITIELSNEAKENIMLTEENTYIFHMSTHEKLIHVQTSTSDGEPHAWFIQLNTKDSTFSVRDDDGQQFNISTKERLVELLNKDGCKVQLTKRNINIIAPDNVNITAKRVNVNGSDAINLQTRDFSHTSSGYKARATTFQYTGAGTISNNWSVGGNLSVEGTSNHKGQSTGPGHR